MSVAVEHEKSDATWTIEGDGLIGAPDREWLLANGLGGYALGSVGGTPTRRYHGMLIASMSAPVERVSCVSAIDETIVLNFGSPGARRVHLSRFQFRNDERPPAVPETLVRFERVAMGVRWIHRIVESGIEIEIEKSLHLYEHRNAARLKYAVRSAGAAVRLELRPLVRLMDHHELSHDDQDNVLEVQTREIDGGCVVMRKGAGVSLASHDSMFVANPVWWEGVRYERDHERGQDSLEDLFSPGVFQWTTVPATGTSSVIVDITCEAADVPSTVDDTAQSERRIAEHIRKAIVRAGGDALAQQDQMKIATLVRAADQFVVERHDRQAPDARGGPAKGSSIVAGYPWFGDWGRDSMIALAGLTLTTGRLEEARSVLETFARHRQNGLIPNRFEDSTGKAEFNTVDASLLFVKAACEYGEASGESLGGEVLDACVEILGAYANGTDFGIRLDSDGLIAAGDESTQLTWMDATRDGKVFTSRHGKAIEVNALWHHGLLAFAKQIEGPDTPRAASCRERAAACKQAIEEKFWNEAGGYLFDRLKLVDGSWRGVAELRPNQLFAIGLEHAPVEGDRATSTLAVVERELLMTGGVRTLQASASAYHGRFEGAMPDRDASYHNGTAWPWLVGIYSDAVLRLRGRTPESLDQIRRALDPLIEAMSERCVGQLGEIFDGDDDEEQPTSEHGCVAQAWSVGEVLRVMVLVARGA